MNGIDLLALAISLGAGIFFYLNPKYFKLIVESNYKAFGVRYKTNNNLERVGKTLGLLFIVLGLIMFAGFMMQYYGSTSSFN